jgi:hypothetical protein
MHRPCCREVLDYASPLALFDGLDAFESGRGLPQSKTLARFRDPGREIRVQRILTRSAWNGRKAPGGSWRLVRAGLLRLGTAALRLWGADGPSARI